MATTGFALITPGEVKFEGTAEIVVAPGAAGDLAALAQHAPMLTTLRAGILRATVVDAKYPGERSRVEYAVSGGFLHILPDKVVVLTDLALGPQEIDADAARADLRRAEQGSAGSKDGDAEHRRAAAWANARLELIGK